MPRPKKPGVEPKRRSRNGCWPCKARKVKCGEEKPACTNCERQGEVCDYSIRLTWGGRARRDKIDTCLDASSATEGNPYEACFQVEDTSRMFMSTSESPMQLQHDIDPITMQVMPPSVTSAGSTEGSSFFQSDISSSTPYTQSHFQNTFDGQSSTTPSFGTFNTNASVLTPTNTTTPPQQMAADTMFRHQKYRAFSGSPGPTYSDSYSPTPHSPYRNFPQTPASVGSEGVIAPAASASQDPALSPPNPCRVSVQSLIQDLQNTGQGGSGTQYPIADSASTTYGYDLGLPDLDTPRNNDSSAIAIYSPQTNTVSFDGETLYGSAESESKVMAFEKGGYYAKPVPIRISKSLEPLPALLMENQMNLIYFHHFLNHTARVLVPHDCERNPFRHILPQMAVKDENLLSLLLAYSASHRARMLNHPEPSNRIAVWVQDVFPRLRQTLQENPNEVPDNTLASVIMMASLEIISPGTFEVPISWKDHLTMARQMITQRGGPRGMSRKDLVAYFLSRWFAYLDVVGSLSGHKNDMPLGSFYWSSENESADEDLEIDCLMGFTTRCVGSLARISELSKRCEPHRIDEHGDVREDWVPSQDVVEEAINIRRTLEDGLSDRNIRKACRHGSDASSESERAWDTTEIYATNKLFHWAGLIQLHRRVLGKSALDPEVQHAVRAIVELLFKIRRGSSAEACSLFPMFAAGCDAQDVGQREKILDRLRGVEGFGLNQVPKMSTLMKRVWDTGKPWESLVSGEFFG
ncbi:hypothetical protein COCMIDRAFT_107576 [Bipolaris oryzae ATCC 44560]|uniref:Zn(2)-C6 fungal-type domain-containing protein n=1 Tax=Bipolaris oryzae ATCC 44560 TaxID=930090 RepID=W6YNH7_COCMI|nr:uncharacterized protein COCMIDRAFT_107576 [Bipolaris oryzae ATCC 44560]EUC40902.1 hypothetical protein COCMIDRAFT_107576 [Bipolaris oryzae ATCC 44560]